MTAGRDTGTLQSRSLRLSNRAPYGLLERAAQNYWRQTVVPNLAMWNQGRALTWPARIETEYYLSILQFVGGAIGFRAFVRDTGWTNVAALYSQVYPLAACCRHRPMTSVYGLLMSGCPYVGRQEDCDEAALRTVPAHQPVCNARLALRV